MGQEVHISSRPLTSNTGKNYCGGSGEQQDYFHFRYNFDYG